MTPISLFNGVSGQLAKVHFKYSGEVQLEMFGNMLESRITEAEGEVVGNLEPTNSHYETVSLNLRSNLFSNYLFSFTSRLVRAFSS